MGKWMRKCKRVGEMMELKDVGHGGSETRATEGEEEEVTSSPSSKRMKLDSYEPAESPSSSGFPARRSIDPSVGGGNYGSPAASATSDPAFAVSGSSCCESADFKDFLKSLDLKAEGVKTEISTFVNGELSGAATPSTNTSDVCGYIVDEMDSTTTTEAAAAAKSQRKLPATKMPSTAEIEDFFSVAEKHQQKSFADKYNYDVVKDVPLEGRYEWVRLKP